MLGIGGLSSLSGSNACPKVAKPISVKLTRYFVGLLCFSSLCLSSCGQVKAPGGIPAGTDAGPAQHGGRKQAQQPQEAPPPAPPANPEEAAKNGMLNGEWRLGFKYNGQTFNASMTLKQNGGSFTGKGKEDESGNDFVIEQGRISGDQLTFVKKYLGKNASIPPIQYAGAITIANEQNYQGPYLSGDYSLPQKDGSAVNSEWDAVQDNSAAQAAAQAPPPPQEEQAPPPQPQQPVQPSQNTSRLDKAPDLSGKWNVGFEYHFGTVHSVMFLEQDHDKFAGHGIDDNKEKFVIEKGWYNFPKLTLVRKYPKQDPIKVKGKTHEGKPEHSITFKGTVSLANDKDYQGLYMSGKTEGGGQWEAEQFK